MLFNIDVRHTVCKKVAERTKLIELRTDLDLVRKEEVDNNRQIAEMLKEAIGIMDDIIELKIAEEKKVMHKFEKEFYEDVLKNQDFYKMRLEG